MGDRLLFQQRRQRRLPHRQHHGRQVQARLPGRGESYLQQRVLSRQAKPGGRNDIVLAGGEVTAGFNAVLERKGSIGGKVVNPIGQPLIYVTCSLYARDPVAGWSYVGYTSPGETGTYAFSGVDCGEYLVTFSSVYHDVHHYGGASTAAASVIIVGDGQAVTGIDSQMTTRYGSIGGIVQDIYGSPMTGVSVTLGGTPTLQSSATSGADGRWLLETLDTGSYTIHFSNDGYRSEYYDDATSPETASTLTVNAGTHHWLTTSMHGIYGSVQGLVSKEGGAAFRSARIDLYQSSSGLWSLYGTAYASTTGAYSFRALEAGDYRLRFLDSTGFHLTEYFDNKPSLALADTIRIDGDRRTADAVLAVTPNIAWKYADTTYYQSHGAAGGNLLPDAAGNLYLTGPGLCLVKLNRVGRRVWLRRLDTRNGTGRFLSFDGRGNIIVAGVIVKRNFRDYLDIIVAKYSPAGKRLWCKVFDGPGPEKPIYYDTDDLRGMHVDSRGYIYLGGTISGKGINGRWDSDVMLMKLRGSDGRRLWLSHRDFGTASRYFGDDRVSDMTADKDGNIILVGRRSAWTPLVIEARSSRTMATDEDAIIVKYKPDGRLLWSRVFGNAAYTSEEEAQAVAVDGKDNIYVADRGRALPGKLVYDAMLVKYRYDGKLLKARWISSTNKGNDWANDVACDSKNNVYMVGSYGSSNAVNSHPQRLIVKYDAVGNTEWMKLGPNTSDGSGDYNSVIIDCAGNPVAAGEMGSYFDGALVKYKAADGTVTWQKVFRDTNDFWRVAVDHGPAPDRRNDIYVMPYDELAVFKVLN